MSVFDEIFETSAPAAQGARGRDGKVREKSEFWLNIGREREVPNAEGGTDKVFVGLPKGLALNMERLPTNTAKPDHNKLQAARNALLDMLIQGGLKMEPGATQILNLQVQIRRVRTDEKVTQENAAENQFVITDSVF